MKLLARLAALALAPLALPSPAWPCTAFLVCSEGRVLMGNNEDFWDPETRIWFVPAAGTRHGVVYLGYANLFPQGGLNDAGLAFDGFATEEYPLVEQEGKEVFPGQLIAEVMETCATVEEVVAMLGRYDLSMLSKAMLFFADKGGDSVIVEGDALLRKRGPSQVVTNFYQSRQEDDLAQCSRYATAVSMLEAEEEASLALCRRVLAATAQEVGAPTQYSNVFDLELGRIHLYHFHNFEHALVLDLAEELEKGRRTLRIPDLFPETFAFRTFLAQRARNEARRQGGEAVSVAPELLDEYGGDYEVQDPDQGPVRFAFRRDGERFLVASEAFRKVGDQVEFELAADADDEFFLARPGWSLGFKFTRDDEGTVDGIDVTTDGGEARGRRVGDS